MKVTAFTTFLFSLIIFVSGMMAFQYTENTFAIVSEVMVSIILFVSAFFMIKKHKLANYLALLLCIYLFGLYGYTFVKTTNFFPGILAALSAYVGLLQVLRIFRLDQE